MKRLFLTLFILLLAVPALADTPEEALSALHPGLKVTSSVVAEGDAFFLLQAPDDVRSLCVLRETDGAWTELLHSESVISPARRMELHSSYWYDDIDLIRDGATLSLRYSYRTSAAWQYDFARDEAGIWRFVRLTTEAPTSPVLVDVLTYEGGCVQQTFTKRLPDGGEEVTPFAPCPMPWLADMLTLADFDASAFPMDVSGMPEDMLTRVAAELLPGYTFVDGCFSDGAAFLMDKPTGERVFMGGEYRDGAWIWVESRPLPEGTLCDSYHGSGSVLPIAFPKPNPSPDWDSFPYAEWGEVPYNEYVLYRQTDSGSPAGSRWLICSICDEADDFFHFEEGGLYHNTSGMAFGEYLGERDVSKVDWQSVPHTFEEALALMSQEWGVVGVDRIALRSGPGADMQEMALCRFGAPVEVLAVHDGWANVSILRGALTGWLPEDALLLGAEQMIPLTGYDDMWGFDSDVVCAAYAAPKLTCFGGTSLLDAPEGSLVWENASNEYMQLVCECPDGWVLVCWPETLSGGFIRAEFTTPESEAALSPALAREYFPEDALVYGEEYDGLAMLLLDRPGGTRVLACGANEDGAWSWTESSPLPAGTLLAVNNNSDAVLCLNEGETEFCVIISHDESEWRITELQDSGFNWMYTDGMLMAEDGTAAAGQPGFDPDIRRTDWSALPTTLEDALGMLMPPEEVFLPVPEGCRLEQGWVQTDSAMYLLRRADGSTTFAGYELTPDGWALTESTPLPEGSALDPGYVTPGSILLNLPDGLAAEISLRDGAWHICALYGPALTMAVQPNGFGGAEAFWYGDMTLETDVTKVDWSALPVTAEALRACLDTSAWRIIAEDTQAWRYSGETDTYRKGTAVRLVYEQDGLAAVSVLGGSVLTCVPSDVLVSADTQFEPESWAVFVNPWFVPRIFLHADAASVTLCDAPGGEPLHILPTGEGRDLNVLADCSEDGWLHVESAWDHLDGYVHVDELPTFKRMR